MRSWELKGYCAVVSIVMQSCHSLSLQQNSPRHDKQEKLVEIIDDEEKRLLKLMGWKDGGTESMVSYF